MSSSLYYKIIVPNEGVCLSNKLKYILKDHFNLGEGPHTLKFEDKAYLQGLADAGVEDAAKLLDVMKHGRGEIQISLEY